MASPRSGRLVLSVLGCIALLTAVLACSDESVAPGGGGSGAGSSSGGSPGTGAMSVGAGHAGGEGPAAGGGGASGGGLPGGGGSGGGGPLTVAGCYADDFVNPFTGGPDYDQFGVVVGSHCMGTNHQDIAGVERVVFLGDSVTVGTPPTLSGDYFRTQVAAALVDQFSLDEPDFFWQSVNPFEGTSNVRESGDFASCAEWGARTDDLLEDGTQLADCLPQDQRDRVTLVVMTIGGNDLSSLTQAAIDGAPEAELWAQTEAFVQKLTDAVAWIKEPGRFPNGVYVVFANMYEFTDGTGTVESCDVSGLAGFDEPVPSPEQLAEMVIWANEQYARTAVDFDVDMIFLLEDFCGHGFQRDDPRSPCYRGPGQDGWFDVTCIHPNPTGHDHLTEMFMAVVQE